MFFKIRCKGTTFFAYNCYHKMQKIYHNMQKGAKTRFFFPFPRVFAPPNYQKTVLNLSSNQEIIHCKTDPAERQNKDTGNDFADETAFSGFEDVEYAPNSAHDSQYINDSAKHKFECYLKFESLKVSAGSSPTWCSAYRRIS